MPTPDFKNAVTTIATDLRTIKNELATIIAAADAVALSPRVGAAPARFRLSMALLKFQQGLIVFCTAIISALFIGAPNTKQWAPHEVPADPAKGTSAHVETFTVLQNLTWNDLYWRTIELLVACVVTATIVALLTQGFQKWIDETKRGARIFFFLTLVVAAVGFWAAWPFLVGAWAWRP